MLDTAALTKAAESVLRPNDHWVNFNLGTTWPWPDVAGMVLALDQRGVQSTVTPASWALYFGHERTPGRAVNVQFDVFAATDRAAAAANRGTVIAVVDGIVLAVP